MHRPTTKQFRELAEAQWQSQEASRKACKATRRRLLAANRVSESPLPVCKKCRHPIVAEEVHWLFGALCDNHGINRLEDLVRRIVDVRGRRRALRALKRLGR